MSSNPQATSSNSPFTSSYLGVARLKAQVTKSKARVEAIKTRIR